MRTTALLLILCTVACTQHTANTGDETCDGYDACPEGLVCLQGHCIQTCAEHADCPPGEFCCNSVCATRCRPCEIHETYCSHALGCRDLASDAEHCNGCERSCRTVTDGRSDTCRAGACVCGEQAGPCPEGLTCCDGECVDAQTRHEYCGGCDAGCTAGQACEDGDCIAACATGTPCTVTAGVECAVLSSNLHHCNDCATDCVADFGSRVDACVAGACVCADVGTACAPGEVCLDANGDTVEECVAETCDASTCPLGCCDDVICRSQAHATCGVAGEACIHCQDTLGGRADACDTSGSCVCSATGEACAEGEICLAGGCAGTCTGEGTECAPPGCSGGRYITYTCQSGACLVDAEDECDDGNPCTNDICNPLFGCGANDAEPGTVCDDPTCHAGFHVVYQCNASAACMPVQTNCDDDNECTSDQCDPTGGCSSTNLPDTATCTGGVCDGDGNCVGCNVDGDCPDDDWVGNPWCASNDVRQTWRDWSCSISHVCEYSQSTQTRDDCNNLTECCWTGEPNCRDIFHSYSGSWPDTWNESNCPAGKINCSCEMGCGTDDCGSHNKNCCG